MFQRLKLFRSCVGRHIVTYLEDLPNYGQLTTVKQLLDTVENRYKKAVNVHAERLNFRSIGINPGESLLDYGSNTSEAGGSRKRFACSRCGSNRHASNDKACPALGKKCNNCSLTGHFAQYCKTKASRIDAELAKSSKKATASKNPRQCNNIQANANDSNEENSDGSQIYSVATINKIDVKHKYMEVRLNGMPIKMLVDSGSNVTIVTAEVFNKIKRSQAGIVSREAEGLSVKGNSCFRRILC